MDDDQQMELLEELSTVKALVREMDKKLRQCVKMHSLSYQYGELFYDLDDSVFGILNRPEVRKIMEGE